jgi:hypothetical protein
MKMTSWLGNVPAPQASVFQWRRTRGRKKTQRKEMRIKQAECKARVRRVQGEDKKNVDRPRGISGLYNASCIIQRMADGSLFSARDGWPCNKPAHHQATNLFVPA